MYTYYVTGMNSAVVMVIHSMDTGLSALDLGLVLGLDLPSPHPMRFMLISAIQVRDALDFFSHKQ